MPKEREGKTSYNDKIQAKRAKEERAYRDRKNKERGKGK